MTDSDSPTLPLTTAALDEYERLARAVDDALSVRAAEYARDPRSQSCYDAGERVGAARRILSRALDDTATVLALVSAARRNGKAPGCVPACYTVHFCDEGRAPVPTPTEDNHA